MTNPKQLTGDSESHLALFDNPAYNPVAYLDQKQQLYCTYQTASSSITKKRMCDILNVSQYILSKWDKNPHVQNYIHSLRSALSTKNVSEDLSNQNKILQDLTFQEMLSRFDRPNPERDLPPNATDIEKRMYHERFVSNMRAADMGKFYDTISKNAREDAKTLGNGNSVIVEEVERIRRKYHESRKEEHKRQDAMSEIGFDPTKSMMENLAALDQKNKNSNRVITINEDGSREITDDSDQHSTSSFEIERVVTKIYRGNKDE